MKLGQNTNPIAAVLRGAPPPPAAAEAHAAEEMRDRTHLDEETRQPASEEDVRGGREAALRGDQAARAKIDPDERREGGRQQHENTGAVPMPSAPVARPEGAVDVAKLAGIDDRGQRASALTSAVREGTTAETRALSAKALLRDPATQAGLNEADKDALASALSGATQLSGSEFRARDAIFEPSEPAASTGAQRAYLGSDEYARRLQADASPKGRAAVHGAELAKLGRMDRSLVEPAHLEALTKLGDRTSLDALKDATPDQLMRASQSIVDRLHVAGSLTSSAAIDDGSLAGDLAASVHAGRGATSPAAAMDQMHGAASEQAKEVIDLVERQTNMPSLLATYGAQLGAGPRGLAEGYALAARHLDRTAPFTRPNLDERKLSGLTALGALNGWTTFGRAA